MTTVVIITAMCGHSVLVGERTWESIRASVSPRAVVQSDPGISLSLSLPSLRPPITIVVLLLPPSSCFSRSFSAASAARPPTASWFYCGPDLGGHATFCAPTTLLACLVATLSFQASSGAFFPPLQYYGLPAQGNFWCLSSLHKLLLLCPTWYSPCHSTAFVCEANHRLYYETSQTRPHSVKNRQSKLNADNNRDDTRVQLQQNGCRLLAWFAARRILPRFWHACCSDLGIRPPSQHVHSPKVVVAVADARRCVTKVRLVAMTVQRTVANSCNRETCRTEALAVAARFGHDQMPVACSTYTRMVPLPATRKLCT